MRRSSSRPTPTKRPPACFSGATDSWAFLREYERLREEGMGVEPAMVFLGHLFGSWHPRHKKTVG